MNNMSTAKLWFTLKHLQRSI